MTKLKKTIKRVTTDTEIKYAGKYRQFVVALYPGDVIGLRPLGTRQEKRTTLRAVYDLAQKQEAMAARRTKWEAKYGSKR